MRSSSTQVPAQRRPPAHPRTVLIHAAAPDLGCRHPARLPAGASGRPGKFAVTLSSPSGVTCKATHNGRLQMSKASVCNGESVESERLQMLRASGGSVYVALNCGGSPWPEGKKMRFREMALLALCLALAGCGKKGSKGVDSEAPPEDLPLQEALAKSASRRDPVP